VKLQLKEIIGLQSPRGRLLFFAVITLIIFVSPYDWFAKLSLWQHLGVPSPSIGLTRAYWLFIHFDPIGAWERNKLIYAVLLVGLPLLLKDVHTIINKKKP
jgi:hypothetical protein